MKRVSVSVLAAACSMQHTRNLDDTGSDAAAEAVTDASVVEAAPIA